MKDLIKYCLAALSWAFIPSASAESLGNIHPRGHNVTTLHDFPDHRNPGKNISVTFGASTHAIPASNSSKLTKRAEYGLPGVRHEVQFNDWQMDEAMRCVHEQVCKDFQNHGVLPEHKASCTVGDMQAYVCNYVPRYERFLRKLSTKGVLFWGEFEGWNPCDYDEMKRMQTEMRAQLDSPYGWFTEQAWAKTYGWDVRGAEICENMPSNGGIYQFRMSCDGDCGCEHEEAKDSSYFIRTLMQEYSDAPEDVKEKAGDLPPEQLKEWDP